MPRAAPVTRAMRSIARKATDDAASETSQRTAEALAEVDLRLEAEDGLRPAGVERVADDLAGARVGELGLELAVVEHARLASDLAQDVHELEHGGLDPAPDVVSAGRIAFGCFDGRADDLLYIYIVARLATVAEDEWPPAVPELAAEDRDHAGLPERILPRPVDVPKAEVDGRELVQARVEVAVTLRRGLRLTVGSLGSDLGVLTRRKLVGLAVDRAAGGGIDEPAHFRPACGLEQVDGADDVDSGVVGRARGGDPDVHLSGEVVDDLRALALHQLDHRPGLADVRDNQLGAPLEGLVQILAPARGQVVAVHGLVRAAHQ